MPLEDNSPPPTAANQFEQIQQRVRDSVIAMQSSERQRPEDTPSTRTPSLYVEYPSAFYSVKSGLVTPAYLSQRCEEESYRAGRHELPFSLLVVNAPDLEAKVVAWSRAGLRKTDIIGFMGRAGYAVLLPETSKEVANKLAKRLRAVVLHVEAGTSTYPEDGRTFADLVVAAQKRFGQTAEHAA